MVGGAYRSLSRDVTRTFSIGHRAESYWRHDRGTVQVSTLSRADGVDWCRSVQVQPGADRVDRPLRTVDPLNDITGVGCYSAEPTISSTSDTPGPSEPPKGEPHGRSKDTSEEASGTDRRSTRRPPPNSWGSREAELVRSRMRGLPPGTLGVRGTDGQFEWKKKDLTAFLNEAGEEG